MSVMRPVFGALSSIYQVFSSELVETRNIEKVRSHAVQCLQSVFHGVSFFSHLFVVKLVLPFVLTPSGKYAGRFWGPMCHPVVPFTFTLHCVDQPSEKLVSVGHSNAVLMLHGKDAAFTPKCHCIASQRVYTQSLSTPWWDSLTPLPSAAPAF